MYMHSCLHLDGSCKTFAVLCDKLHNVLHAGPVSGIETVAIGCLPGLCLHCKSKLQGLWGKGRQVTLENSVQNEDFL